MRRLLLWLTLLSIGLVSSWYFFLYPSEAWIRYNVWLRADSLNDFADFVESNDHFDEILMIGDDVFIDRSPAPPNIVEAAHHHFDRARLIRGKKAEYGSFYYLGPTSKWPNYYQAALIRSPDDSDDPDCSRFATLSPGESCVFRLDDRWMLHYINLNLLESDALRFAEEVAEELGGQQDAED